MAKHPTENKSIAAKPAVSVVVRTQAAMPMSQPSRRKCWLPITSAAPCEASAASSASAVRPSSLGSKKAERLPPLETTLAPVLPEDVLEMDELWSFVHHRKNKRWVWLAQCRRTRQIVAYAIGGRGQNMCRLLWRRIPKGYKQCVLYTDFWKAYAKVLPASQHRATGKGEGQTCHIERFNNSVRQRLARFVRKTLSFSKSDAMHEMCLRLFLHEYNINKLH
jgi:insertion element IS1 protein InsB